MIELKINHYFINERGLFREIMSKIFNCLERSSNRLEIWKSGVYVYTSVLPPHTKIRFGMEFNTFLTEEAYFKDSAVRRTIIWK